MAGLDDAGARRSSPPSSGWHARSGAAVTAEGVETAEQLEILRALGCDAAQGWLFSRPLKPDAMAKMLR